MASDLELFEHVARRAFRFSDAAPEARSSGHPFDLRSVHADLPSEVRRLFDDGHYAQATLEALKFVDEEVRRIAGYSDHGTSLMMKVFGGNPPKVKINAGTSLSERNEQEGFKFLFAGAMQAIRNPRTHTSGIVDDPDACMDHLALASMLLRRLDDAGLR